MFAICRAHYVVGVTGSIKGGARRNGRRSFYKIVRQSQNQACSRDDRNQNVPVFVTVPVPVTVTLIDVLIVEEAVTVNVVPAGVEELVTVLVMVDVWVTVDVGIVMVFVVIDLT
jgi:hypothetical protein